jgi:predicted nuclease with RNAse H fold
MKKPLILGLDLSGPSNTADTALAVLQPGEAGLQLVTLELGLDDGAIAELVRTHVPQDAPLLVGLDAPLSYQPGGGDRPGDRALRQELQRVGLPSGTVMTPTMTRMAYLTLRGMAVARLLLALQPQARVAEVHPGGVMVRRGAPVALVKAMKTSQSARSDLLNWLAKMGVSKLPIQAGDHEIAAVAAALGAAHWGQNQKAWQFPARPPLHPFDLIS